MLRPRVCSSFFSATTESGPSFLHEPLPKIRISQRDCARRKCGNLNQPSTRNAFFLHLVLSPNMRQPRRHRLSARQYRAILQGRFQTWNEVTRGKLVGSLLNILSPWLLSPLFLFLTRQYASFERIN